MFLRPPDLIFSVRWKRVFVVVSALGKPFEMPDKAKQDRGAAEQDKNAVIKQPRRVKIAAPRPVKLVKIVVAKPDKQTRVAVIRVAVDRQPKVDKIAAQVVVAKPDKIGAAKPLKPDKIAEGKQPKLDKIVAARKVGARKVAHRRDRVAADRAVADAANCHCSHGILRTPRPVEKQIEQKNPPLEVHRRSSQHNIKGEFSLSFPLLLQQIYSLQRRGKPALLVRETAFFCKYRRLRVPTRCWRVVILLPLVAAT